MNILTEFKAEELLRKEKLNIAMRKVFTSSNLAFEYACSLGFPVVLKIVSDSLVHKAEKKGVYLDVNQLTFEKTFSKLMKLKIKKEGVLVQEQVSGECVFVGLKKDSSFGHVLVVGAGGFLTEVVKDLSFRVLPVNKKDILSMLNELKFYKVLKYKKVNFDKLVDLIFNISKLVKKHKIKELDINPAVVNSRLAKIVDAQIVF